MAIKHLGKKGIFLTFIAISIMAAFILIFTPTNISLKKDISVTKTRVSNINEYVFDLENVYLERTLQSSGIKTIISLINHVDIQGPFTGITTFEAAFEEVLLNGEIDGIPIEGMVGYTFNEWLTNIKTIADNTFNVNTNFIINDIKVFQIRPWFVELESNVSFTVSSETASWNKVAIIRTEIEIENFNDPYYLINTDPNYVNKIHKSNTKFNEWNVEKVKDFISDGNYTHFKNSNAPSFLMRFYNDISASSCCGIESIVNPNNLAIANKDTSYVDYLYWETETPCDNTVLFSVTGLDSEFKLYLEHIAKYRLQDDDYLYCEPTT